MNAHEADKRLAFWRTAVLATMTSFSVISLLALTAVIYLMVR